MATFPIALRNMQMQIDSARKLAQIARETDGNVAEERDARKYASTAGDELTLRGIPAIGFGCAGVIRGTRPDAICERDE